MEIMTVIHRFVNVIEDPEDIGLVVYELTRFMHKLNVKDIETILNERLVSSDFDFSDFYKDLEENKDQIDVIIDQDFRIIEGYVQIKYSYVSK